MRRYLLIIVTIININNVFADNISDLPKHYSLSLTDNSKYNNDSKLLDYVSSKARKGGEISIGVVGNFDNINDNILLGTAATGLHLIYDSLLEKSLDEIATAYMLLAEYYQISVNSNEVIFKIRDTAYWHDNTAITNQDVLFTFNILRSKGHPFYRIAYQDITDARLLSDNKIAFKIKDIKNRDLIMKIGQMPILSRKYYNQNEFNKITLQPALSSGAYKISDLKSGKYISYERVDNYWGKDLFLNRGRYNFDLITYRYYRDANIAIQGLKAREYDIRFENIAKNWAKSYDKELLGAGKLIKKRIEHQIPTGMQCFVMNNRLQKFSDVRVRKALNLAFDFAWTNKNLFYDSYERTHSFFTDIYAASGGLSKFELKFLKDNLTEQNELTRYEYIAELPVNDATGNNRPNLIKAQALLQEAGWHIKDFKLQNQYGEEFTIEFLITSVSFQRVILPFIKNLKKLGIKSHVRMVDFSQYQKQIENFDFDITVNVFGGVNIPANEQFALWHSEYADVAGSSNISGIKNPIIDKILEELVAAANFAEKKQYSKLLDRILRNNFYVIPHWNISAFRLIYWDKFSFPKSSPPYGLAMDSWWVK